jgi:hypothetical protein
MRRSSAKNVQPASACPSGIRWTLKYSLLTAPTGIVPSPLETEERLPLHTLITEPGLRAVQTTVCSDLLTGVLNGDKMDLLAHLHDSKLGRPTTIPVAPVTQHTILNHGPTTAVVT